MQDKLHIYPIDKLLKWILSEETEGKIFGYYTDLFWKPSKNDPLKMERYGQLIDTPLGVAAGPHTQLSQNIILSWLFGARYIELKTVQVLDNIEVTKPCIDMYDEGYNCEWSQELSIEESYNQYLDAWILLHILSNKLGYNFATIFNISVGYDLKGIQSEKVKWFLSKMKDSSDEMKTKIEPVSKIYPFVKEIEIPKEISNNVTLSTMHGCPPDEIEKIAKHLIEDWKFHTAVKLNPTILGKERLRDILNNKLGYNINIPDEAFEHDLKYEDSIKIINELQYTAENNGVEFGIKMTNTLESLNSTELLPKKENMVYMSGRSLHPISINAAAILQNEYQGNLDISFSGGADAFNFTDIITSNLKPVTVCSDLLKPGGYSRLPQYLSNLKKAMYDQEASSIDEYIIKKGKQNNIVLAGLNNLEKYSKDVINDKRYKKSFNKHQSIKTNRELTTFDCVHAPCIETCAVNQNVPEYLFHASKNNFAETFKTILEDNPLPNITGMVCDHLCQTKCTRMNIDNSILIREVKRYAAEKESENFNKVKNNSLHKKAAIIGAGPSGLSAAYFLSLKGVDVDIFESHDFAGGMASSTIPKFRINKTSLIKDIKNIESLGAKLHYNVMIDKEKFEKIRSEFDFVYIAVGAQHGKRLGIKGEDSDGVIDQITFLEKINSGEKVKVGSHAAVIGGGNSAMDAARTAKRLVNNGGSVTLVYRRTKNEMPADKEEIEALIEEGIKIYELTAPKEINKVQEKLQLVCTKMELGEPDESGRRRPLEIQNSDFFLEFDSIITAIGQEVNLDFIPEGKLEINEQTQETNYKNVYAGGDFIRGADSLINATADGKNVAKTIIKNINVVNKQEAKISKIDLREYQKKLSLRIYGEDLKSIPLDERDSFKLVNPLMDEESVVKEASRCLYCDEICNICVSVCPNLANQYIEIKPTVIKYPLVGFTTGEYKISSWNALEVKQQYQIININDFCNECGDCDTFCPTSGAPYKVKPKFALREESFAEMETGYYYNNDILFFKNKEITSELRLEDNVIIYSDNNYNAKFDFNFNPINIEMKNKINQQIDTKKIAEMYFFYKNMSNTFFNN